VAQLRALNIQLPALAKPQEALPEDEAAAEAVRRGRGAPWACLPGGEGEQISLEQYEYAHNLRLAMPAHPAVQSVMLETAVGGWRLDYKGSKRELEDARWILLAWSQGGLGELGEESGVGAPMEEGPRCMGTTEVLIQLLTARGHPLERAVEAFYSPQFMPTEASLGSILKATTAFISSLHLAILWQWAVLRADEAYDTVLCAVQHAVLSPMVDRLRSLFEKSFLDRDLEYHKALAVLTQQPLADYGMDKSLVEAVVVIEEVPSARHTTAAITAAAGETTGASEKGTPSSEQVQPPHAKPRVLTPSEKLKLRLGQLEELEAELAHGDPAGAAAGAVGGAGLEAAGLKSDVQLWRRLDPAVVVAITSLQRIPAEVAPGVKLHCIVQSCKALLTLYVHIW